MGRRAGPGGRRLDPGPRRRDRPLAPPASEEFEALAGYGLACTYAPNVWSDGDLEEAFRARIEERRHDELVRRSSLVGPHRDDLELAVRDLGARAFASHGEAWAAALCLRLGLATAVEREIGEPPILLVDDPFSALDPRRRDQIGERLAARGGQVVISVADEADVPDAAHATWDVRAGTVTPRSRLMPNAKGWRTRTRSSGPATRCSSATSSTG